MMKSVVMAGALAVLALALGCEKVSRALTLKVEPETTELIFPDRAVLLTAVIPENAGTNAYIVYPLVWSVSDSRLGSLRDAAGNSAVYVANYIEGVNTVTVRDQAGAEGIASITQAKPSETTQSE